MLARPPGIVYAAPPLRTVCQHRRSSRIRLFDPNERLRSHRDPSKPEYLRYILGPLGVRNYEIEEERPT